MPPSKPLFADPWDWCLEAADRLQWELGKLSLNFVRDISNALKTSFSGIDFLPVIQRYWVFSPSLTNVNEKYDINQKWFAISTFNTFVLFTLTNSAFWYLSVLD